MIITTMYGTAYGYSVPMAWLATRLRLETGAQQGHIGS